MMIYKKAPLPFRGQKTGWFEEFKTMLETFPDCTTIIDVFGGSGLLAHQARRLRPDARVVWNDFDNYRERLLRIPETNELKRDIFALLSGIRHEKKIPPETITSIKQILRNHVKKFGYLDCITVSTWILFSGNYFKTWEEFEKEEKRFLAPFDFVRSLPHPGYLFKRAYRGKGGLAGIFYGSRLRHGPDAFSAGSALFLYGRIQLRGSYDLPGPK